MPANRRHVVASLGLAPWAGATLANEGGYPSRPLRMIVPLGAGSTFDATSRYFADALGQVLGRPIVVENRPGADTAVGIQAMLAAPADGYTLLALTGGSVSITPYLANAGYDPRDLKAFVGIDKGSAAFAVTTNSRLRTLQQVIDELRAKQSGVSLAHYGQIYRLGSRLFETLAKVSFNHVPYNEPSRVTTDLLGGFVDVAVLGTSAAIKLAKDGRVRILAIANKARHPEIPEVPTFIDSGWAGFTIEPWTAFAVAARTSPGIFARLEQAGLQVVTAPATTRWLLDHQSEPMPYTSEQMARLIQKETAALAPFIREIR